MLNTCLMQGIKKIKFDLYADEHSQTAKLLGSTADWHPFNVYGIIYRSYPILFYWCCGKCHLINGVKHFALLGQRSTRASGTFIQRICWQEYGPKIHWIRPMYGVRCFWQWQVMIGVVLTSCIQAYPKLINKTCTYSLFEIHQRVSLEHSYVGNTLTKMSRYDSAINKCNGRHKPFKVLSFKYCLRIIIRNLSPFV